MKGKLFAGILLVGLYVVAIGAAPSDSDPPVPLEYQIKAAFLHNFVKFVEWPEGVLPDTLDTITIGVIGEGPMYDGLESVVEGKTVKGRALSIQRFRRPEDLTFCHVLFVGRSEKERLKAILKRVENSRTLTVGEIEKFADQGGAINFIIVENRVRFEINLEAAKDAHLAISSRLLRLAKIIRRKR